MISRIKFINTPITLYTYHCVGIYVRTRKIYSFSKFQVYTTVLLTIVTMLYITSPELTHLTT